MRIVLLLLSLPLLAIGGQGLYGVARNPQQVAVTCAEVARQRPRALWLRVTGCELDYLNPGYRESRGQMTELFFPVRPAGQPRTAPAALVVATRDPEALAVARTAIGTGGRPDQEAFIVAMLRIVTILRASREVEGFARGGAIEVLRARRTLASLNAPLAAGYLVLDLHERPRALVPALETSAGALAFLGFVLLLVRGRRREATVEPVEETESAAKAPGPPAPRTVLPPMMVLNLDPSATLEAIEHAPPLGPIADVRARLRAALPGTRLDKDGRGTVEGSDYSLRIDIGKTEPVWTATVVAEGDGAVAALRALAAATRWRLYVPKRGVFLGAERMEGEPADGTQH
jgi:hypothetical protein